MKKILIAILAATTLFSFASCSEPAADDKADATTEAVQGDEVNADDSSQSGEPTYAAIIDFDGNEVNVKQNPTKVAVYDYAILDILNNIGYESTGIQQLVVPSKDTLPDALSFYKNLPDDKVVSGGSLFYVDADVLDIVVPDLVVLGGRSFGMNASGERLASEDAAKFKSDTMTRYADTAFAKLSTNSSNSNLTADVEKNVTALGQIFPNVKPALDAKLADIKSQIEAINAVAKASGKKALFCMMVDQTTLSVFNPESRFDMLYEDFGFAPVDSEAVRWEDSHGFDVRAEYVLEKNPDVIFILDRSATVGSGAGADNFMEDPVIKQTNASINGDIYVLTGDAWYTMTGGFTAIETMIADLNQYIQK